MKKLLLLFVFSLVSIFSKAQAPQSFKYQAVIRDVSGNILSNQNVSLKILLLETSSSGSVVFSETHNVITNNYGLINLEIGTGTLLSGNFNAINWGGNSHYIRIELDENGGNNFQVMGTSQLLSVPYALYAESSGGAGQTYTAGSGISITGNVISNISPDQNVIITGSGSTSVSGTYPNFTISSTDNVNDADFDPSNEIQTITQTGTNVTLSNGGGTFSVNDGDTSLWKMNGSDIYRNNGSVGIGTTIPKYKLNILDTLNDNRRYGVFGSFIGGSNVDSIYGGVGIEILGVNGVNRAGYYGSNGNSQGYNMGLLGSATKAQLGNYGIVGIVSNSQGVSSLGVGLYGYSENGEYENIGAWGIAQGSNETDYNVGGQFEAMGLGDISAPVSSNIGLLPSAYGNHSENVGIRTTGGSGSPTGFQMSSINYGIHARAIDPSAANYGIYAEALNGTVSYAGYFDGDVTVTGTFVNPSDRKFKENIHRTNSVLMDLMKLKTYSYTYSSGFGINFPKTVQIGFIAQDVEQVFPNLVINQKSPIFTDIKTGKIITNPITGKTKEEVITKSNYIDYKGVNYIGMIPLLLQGIQEQQLIIENQNEEIVKLNNRLLILEEQIQKLLNK